MRLYDQLQERLDAHRYNGYFTICCPYHNESHPSCFVYESGFFTCKSCGAKGSLEKLNKHLGGKSVITKSHSNTVLPRWREWENKWGDITNIAKHAHLSLKRYPQWNFYFKERKISEFVEFGYLGFIDGWATFPVFDQNHKVQNIVVRHTKNSGTRYAIKAMDDKAPLLYVPNWGRVMASETVYVVYGIIDAISLELIGLPVVTGIMGKSLSAETLKPLGKQFVIVPDEYEDKEAHLLANSLGWKARVKRLVYPEGVKDPDGIRTHFGNDFLLGALA